MDMTRRQSEMKLAQIQRDQDKRARQPLADLDTLVANRYPGDIAKQNLVRAGALKTALHCAGVPETPAEQAVTDQYEMGLRAAEIVHAYYDGPGHKVRALHMPPPEIEPQIMARMERNVRKHMSYFASGPDGEAPQGITHGNPPLPPEMGITATLSNRLNERWPLVNDQAFADVIEIAKNQPSCDVQMSGTGNCVSLMQTLFRHKLSGCNPIPIPFDVGSIIVVGSICEICWSLFSNRYELGDTSIGEPFDSER